MDLLQLSQEIFDYTYETIVFYIFPDVAGRSNLSVVCNGDPHTNKE
jgi:hypothetical protein